MCGLAGILTSFAVDWEQTLHRMGDAIAHRGPDSSGCWYDPESGIGLAHRRLSILDLSPNGHQPMTSEGGRYVISYNGEIYNFADLRQELESQSTKTISFRGTSDTEVLLAAIESWGIQATLKKCCGMFAFALWDRREKTLHLARDRFGEKPLYYGWHGESLLFASELKSFHSFPGFKPAVDREAVSQFLDYSYVPAPRTIYQNVFKLMPGYYGSFKKEVIGKPLQMAPYWTLEECIGSALSDPFTGSDLEAEEALLSILQQAVKRQMVSDVPLGAFLSGGIDSSSIVALMREVGSSNIKTFTIGNDFSAYDESVDAERVAKHLHTDHTCVHVKSADALELVPLLPEIYDEPFGDSSQIPTYLVSKIAREHVTVSLSGDAGDEVFGGYNRHVFAKETWPRIERIPRFLRRLIGRTGTSLSHQQWDKLFGLLPIPKKSVPRLPGMKIHKLSKTLNCSDKQEVYRQLARLHDSTREYVLGTRADENAFVKKSWLDLPDFTSEMMYQDTIGYLPNDILTKVDRAAMAVSLESRIPFLDPQVVQFAWSLPLSLKVRNGKGKWLLRRVLNRFVPEQLFDRPKMGFGVPIAQWLRGPLGSWAEDLLSHDRIQREGILDPVAVQREWSFFKEHRKQNEFLIWNFLMFQAWNARFASA